MIGLGSNRLSVCRRGGMSVTQAGRGGMEWLAGGRRPRWSSPYSAQATAALKAQFPTQWPTIRDYGWQHPEIVGYMNAYAPEDAKIAYSLVDGIGKRLVVGDGTGSFKTGIQYTYGQGKELVVELASIGFRVGYGSYPIIFGSDTYHSLPLSSDSGCVYARANTSGYTVAWYDCINTLVTVHLFDRTADIEGGYRAQWNTNPSLNTGNGEIIIGKVGSNSSFPAKYAKFQQYSSSRELEAWFIPFQRNGVMELLDLVSGNLATRVGTFTELIETPS